MQQQTPRQKIKVAEDLFALLSECTPGTHAWGLIIHKCVLMLMIGHISKLQDRIDRPIDENEAEI